MTNTSASILALVGALERPDVRAVAQKISSSGEVNTSDLLHLAKELCGAAGDLARERILHAELDGYDQADVEIPDRRRVPGYASPFPVRAIGLLDPEEIFLANREKFAQVTLTIGQSVRELENALTQIQDGGVLALRVPASEVSGEAAGTDDQTEVFIYIMPREIERVVENSMRLVLDALVARIVEAASDVPEAAPDEIDEVSA